MKKENWEVKMGTTHPIYEHHSICWGQTRETLLKTREALANPPRFPVPPILLQDCSTLSRTQRHFLVGKQNERNYSWRFQISKLSRDLMYDTRIGQKSMQDKRVSGSRWRLSPIGPLSSWSPSFALPIGETVSHFFIVPYQVLCCQNNSFYKTNICLNIFECSSLKNWRKAHNPNTRKCW